MELNIIVLNSEAEADSLNNVITANMQPSISDGITTKYCEPQKHPVEQKWFVPVQPGYEQFIPADKLLLAVPFTDDWLNFIVP